MIEKYKIWAEIDTDALRENWRRISDHVHKASPACRVIAVVKANAYGHGADLVARTLLTEGCDFFAVSCVYEAVSLRECIGDAADILLLGYSLPEDVPSLVRHRIIQTVFSPENAEEMSRAMAHCIDRGILPPQSVLRTHLKLDTGMNRLGFDTADPTDASDAICATLALPHLAPEGMFTHFACADETENPLSARQYARFAAVAARLRERGCCPPFLHCANSAAALSMPDKYEGGVRVGILLYGISPSGEILPGYRPVMRLRARIAHIHTLRAGESVSYGATFTAPQDMRIATVPLGYADGFVRHFGAASLRLPDGGDAPIVGRICMDQCMIAIGDSDVRPGDAVTVFGGDDGSMLETLARIGDTINYEIPCILTPRVPRIPVPDGEGAL